MYAREYFQNGVDGIAVRRVGYTAIDQHVELGHVVDRGTRVAVARVLLGADAIYRTGVDVGGVFGSDARFRNDTTQATSRSLFTLCLFGRKTQGEPKFILFSSHDIELSGEQISAQYSVGIFAANQRACSAICLKIFGSSQPFCNPALARLRTARSIRRWVAEANAMETDQTGKTPRNGVRARKERCARTLSQKPPHRT